MVVLITQFFIFVPSAPFSYVHHISSLFGNISKSCSFSVCVTWKEKNVFNESCVSLIALRYSFHVCSNDGEWVESKMVRFIMQM